MILPLAVGLLALVALRSAAKDEKESDPPKGYTLLFNGKNLEGWKVYGGKMESWSADAENKVLFVKGGGGGWLMTEKEYGDFEVRLEYKVPKDGNSGVALRAPLKGNPAYEGMEIQILDDPSYKGRIKDWQQTGAIYGVVAPSKVPSKPVGEWNKYRIVCKGRKVSVELNGETIVDADLDDYKDKHGKEHPGILREKGHVGLQSHDGRVEFRNLYIKEL
jgi:hypothetical protein